MRKNAMESVTGWHWFHNALKGMLIHASELNDGLHTCGGNVSGINPNYPASFVMDLQHDA